MDSCQAYVNDYIVLHSEYYNMIAGKTIRKYTYDGRIVCTGSKSIDISKDYLHKPFTANYKLWVHISYHKGLNP